MRLALLLFWCCLTALVRAQDIGFTPVEVPGHSLDGGFSRFNLPADFHRGEIELDLQVPKGTLKDTLDEIRLHGNQEAVDPGLLGRFYQRAWLDSQDAALFAWPVDTMSGGGHFDPRHNQFLRDINSGQVSSILQNALAQSFLQEVFGSADQGFLNRPVANSTADFQRRLQSGMDFGLGLNSAGPSARLNWRMFGLQLSGGVSALNKGLDPVTLSWPFLEEDLRGELGVNSRGDAYMYMMLRW